MNSKRKILAGKARLALCAIVVSGLVAGAALASISHFAGAQTQQSNRKTTEPPRGVRGKLGSELFIAVGMQNKAGVDSLLKNGADPNTRNGLDFVPLYLAAATHQNGVVQKLIAAGANPGAESHYGNAVTFASAFGNTDGVKALTELGVKADFVRTDGITPLMMAASAGAAPVIEELVKHKVDVNAQMDSGGTALSIAARNGQPDAGAALIAHGAKVDLADLEGLTPLMVASMDGNADFVKMLLAKGAKPNLKDKQGRTALVLAASYGDRPDVVKALLAGNANPKAADKTGRSALAIAASRGFGGDVAALGGSMPAIRAIDSDVAVNRSLKLIQASMLEFTKSASCISCHQEGLGRMATGEAKARGYKLDPEVQKVQKERIHGMIAAMKPLHEKALVDPHATLDIPLAEINEITPIDTWLLAGMASHKEAPDAANGAMTMVLARQQTPMGFWTFALPRVPMQSSFVTFTALAVQALQNYGPKANAAEIKDRVARAKNWLLVTKTQSSEDRASRLMGLVWGGDDGAGIKQAAGEVLADQHADGGWSQLPGMSSDAYATGQALWALHLAGTPASDAAYRRGAQFLLRTQDADGSWFVSKRAFPANNYFDAGFPHGESQFSSFNGTCWATMALLETVKEKKGHASRG